MQQQHLLISVYIALSFLMQTITTTAVDRCIYRQGLYLQMS